MNIYKLQTKYLSSNTYVLEFNSFSIVIDPSIAYDEVTKIVNKDIAAVLVTHGHYDHIAQIKTYIDRNIQIYIHQKAIEKLKNPRKNLSIYIDCNNPLAVTTDNLVLVNECEKYNINGEEFIALFTPGHSDCSVTYVFEDKYMFTGDFLFQGTVGRTNFPTGDEKVMKQTITRFKQMKKDYFIYPGHGENTTLEKEKINNVYFI